LRGRGLGLIISGQGGSATRVAERIAELPMTHDFGWVVNDTLDPTLDSWAVRKSDVLQTEFRAIGLSSTGRVDYDIDEIMPSSKRLEVQDHVCDSLMRLHQQIRKSNKPWALKEPWVRFLLPFFDHVIGSDNYKFAHVTLDPRYIHDSHGDESYSRLFDEEDTPSDLSVALAHNSSLVAAGFPVEHVIKWTKFAYMWGVIELQLYEWWTTKRSHQYFHISEKVMTGEGAKDTARKFATFLGSTDPEPETLEQMIGAYNISLLKRHHKDHYKLMDEIINLPGLEGTRAAMEALGYS